MLFPQTEFVSLAMIRMIKTSSDEWREEIHPSFGTSSQVIIVGAAGALEKRGCNIMYLKKIYGYEKSTIMAICSNTCFIGL